MEYNITYRQKDKGWQYIISIKEDGRWKQRSKQGFRTKALAKKAADDRLDKMKEDFKSDETVKSEFIGITFGEFKEIYLDHVKLYKTYRTFLSVVTALNRYSSLNEMQIDKITSLDMQRIINKQTKEGLNPNTIKHYLRMIITIFNYAKNTHGIITDVPSNNLEFKKSIPADKRALNDSERTTILNDLKDDKYYMIVFLALNTGMRIGEILGLEWSDIDFDNRTIDVNKQWKEISNKEHGFGELKSKNSKRSIPISHHVCLELKKHRKIISIDRRVFPFKSTKSIAVLLNKILKKYNITVHELRHTYATKLVASNKVDFKTIAAILGHDVEQTLKTYSHVTNDMFENAKSVIENIF